MFDNVAFNVFIGLVFVFLLYSLLATIIQEIVARWLNLRARMLQKGIRRMLQDENVTYKLTIIKIPLEIWKNIVRFFVPFSGNEHSFFKIFYNYPTIKYLAESSWNSKPSYIDASNFSETIVYLLQGSQGSGNANAAEQIKHVLFTCKNVRGVDGKQVDIDKETCEHLGRLWNDAQGDINQFRVNLETWFNRTMDRVSGWYLKQTKLMLFVIGLIIAFNCEVDCIAIYRLLAKDDNARNNMVQLAVSHGSQQNTTSDKTDDKMLREASTAVQADIDQAGQILSVKVANSDSCQVCHFFQKQRAVLVEAENKLIKKKDSTSVIFKKNKNQQAELSLLIKKYEPACRNLPQASLFSWGYLLTALAISFGSSFWFDLLNKLMQIRGTGGKPDDKTATGTDKTSPPVKPVG
ncbi:hypothetical protein [Flavobacterium sp. CLA17]|uniref:hypothetical protein n=1 Tax=Flavobacterium sp. CLA17 TaxID=2724135 RepID=UPI00149116AF|nr:hypothetical protein [Flavobacterium sp. CLA17]QSB29093.1 hypothetical protein HAV12_010245 [Flavobacterium sp. CLA17]